MARYISALANTSQARVYEDFIGRAKALSENESQEFIDEYIAQSMLDPTPPE
ncbi:hypothetical protein [Nodularia chucula]|uniref:hypothetical protein n=1 Tax=Nodularia chucula TaxID=3093667 RepID=UPI0039C61FAC